MIDQHLKAILLQHRGDNDCLVTEIFEKLSPQAKERLQDLRQNTAYELRKRRRGQFWRGSCDRR